MNEPTKFYNSRKFRIALGDAITGILTLLVTRFLTPDDAKFVLQLYGFMQPVLAIWIFSIAYEDGRIKGNKQ